MLIIGDCHGLTGEYFDIIRQYKSDEKIKSILLGELGFKKEHDLFIASGLSRGNKVVFGNHDYFNYLDKPYSMGRFRSLSLPILGNTFTIAGAFSIDKKYRTEDVAWFKEEEMTYTEQVICCSEYEKCKPDTVLSHDAPESVIDAFFNYTYKFPNGNNTNRFYDTLLTLHEPKLWVFAHHHKSVDKYIGKTRFICLNEMEVLDTNKL